MTGTLFRALCLECKEPVPKGKPPWHNRVLKYCGYLCMQAAAQRRYRRRQGIPEAGTVRPRACKMCSAPFATVGSTGRRYCSATCTKLAKRRSRLEARSVVLGTMSADLEVAISEARRKAKAKA